MYPSGCSPYRQSGGKQFGCISQLFVRLPRCSAAPPLPPTVENLTFPTTAPPPPSPPSFTLISECIAPKTSPPLLPLLLLLPPALLLLASYLRSSPCVGAAHPPLSSQYINISTRRFPRMRHTHGSRTGPPSVAAACVRSTID